MTIQSLSKQAASKYRPERPTLLISIQDGDKQELPFKQRTNHITRKRYVDCLFCILMTSIRAPSPVNRL